jgi:hypothetical protein
MATIFVEGFDKYGPIGINYSFTSIPSIPALQNILPQGGWTLSAANTNDPIIEAGLSGQGYAIGLKASSSGAGIYGPNYISKTLPANYSRLIGGFRFNTDALGMNGITFVDGSTPQCSIYIARTSGFIIINTGAIDTTSSGSAGTALATSSASVAAGTAHYLEYDITFGSGASGSYTVWLDGVQILAGTGSTIVTAHSYANVVQFNSYSHNLTTNSPSFYVDDVYVFDNTTAFNNGVLLSNPFIVTQWPNADQSVQFTPEANVIGYPSANILTNTVDFISANNLYLIAVTPTVNCTINSVVFALNSIAGSTVVQPCIYSDNAGVAGTLLSGGAAVTPAVAQTAVSCALTTPQALTAGTQYWIGLIIGGSYGNFMLHDATTHGYQASATYSSGPPATAPTMGAGNPTLFLYGACTTENHNFASVNVNPSQGLGSYAQSSTVGNQDLFQFPSLPSNIGAVYTVVVSGNMELTATGSHTVDLVTSSSATVGFGATTGQALTTAFAWYDSAFDTDPHTTLAWSVAAVNIAYHGYKIAS